MAFTLVAVLLTSTSGFAVHTIQCLITGDTYESLIEKECCCGTPKQEGKKCCDDKSSFENVDAEVAQQEVSYNINPVFFTALIIQLTNLQLPALQEAQYLNYLKNSPPLPDQDIVTLVQSFLL